MKFWVPGTLIKVTLSIQLCDTLPWPIFCCYIETVEEGWCRLVTPQCIRVCRYLCLSQSWTLLLRLFASAPLCQVSELKLTVSSIFSCLILMLVDFKGSCTMFLSKWPEAEKQEMSPNHFLERLEMLSKECEFFLGSSTKIRQFEVILTALWNTSASPVKMQNAQASSAAATELTGTRLLH